MGGGGEKTSTTSAGVPEWAQPYLESAADDAQDLYKGGKFDRVAGLNKDQMGAINQTRDLQGDAQTLQNRASNLGNQAGTDPAFNQAQSTYSDATNQTGVFGADQYGRVAGQMQGQIDNQVTRALGEQQGQFSQSGNLGGARAQAAAANAAGQISSDMAASEVAAQRQGALSGAGAGVQTAGSQFGQQMQGFDAQGSAFQTKAAAAKMLESSGQNIQDQRQAELDAKYQGIQRMFGLINPGTVGTKSETTSTGGK